METFEDLEQKPECGTRDSEKESKTVTIEDQSKYEGNHFMLMAERLRTPEVLGRLVNDKYLDLTTREGSDADLLLKNPTEVKKGIRDKILENITKASEKTHIEFSANGVKASRSGSLREDLQDYTGVVGVKRGDSILDQMSAEAHEKGHNIRYYDESSAVAEQLRSPFDLSRVTVDEKDRAEAQKMLENSYLDYDDDPKEAPQFTIDEVREVVIDSSFGTCNEILERMSELKNYFGMKDGRVFTQEHLDYARENYLKDLKLDSAIGFKPFLDAISDDKAFLKQMNERGV